MKNDSTIWFMHLPCVQVTCVLDVVRSSSTFIAFGDFIFDFIKTSSLKLWTVRIFSMPFVMTMTLKQSHLLVQRR